jgi:hypothetical protein
MKYFILLCILIFALPGFGQIGIQSPFNSTPAFQQDSVTYQKLPNTSESFKGDSIYYKITYSKQGDVMTVRTEPFTDVDSLMAMVFFNEFTDASRQYKQAIEAWEAQEKGYLLRLRQAERQYLAFTGGKIKDKVEEKFDFTELLGDWLLNGKAIVIDAKLQIDKKNIKLLSDVQFQVEIDKEQRIFNRVKAGRWVAKDAKYILERPKEKAKKKGK